MGHAVSSRYCVALKCLTLDVVAEGQYLLRSFLFLGACF